jgi:hypothetical protein
MLQVRVAPRGYCVRVRSGYKMRKAPLRELNEARVAGLHPALAPLADVREVHY